MPSELFFLRQFLSQLGPNYPQVAMLVGLLLVAIYRPERIYLPGMFRLSCVLSRRLVRESEKASAE